MNNKTFFKGMLKKVASVESHPLLSNIEFIFTDFEPNKNKQGIPTEEAQNIIDSAINMPVKVNFKGKIGNHAGAIPVGPIDSVYQNGEAIYAKASIWKDEYPELVDFLEKSLEEEKPVGFSWEIYYQDSDQMSGVEWLRGCVVAAVTMVENPAYKGRTPLLSLAEENEVEIMEELNKKIEELTSKVAEKDSEIEDLKTKMAATEDLLKAANASVKEAESVIKSKTEALSLVTAERDDLRTYREKTEAETRAVRLREDRKKELDFLKTGISFDSNAERFLSMSDDTWKGYIGGLKEQARSTGFASSSSKSRVDIPDPVVQSDETGSDGEFEDIVRFLKEYKKSGS